MSRMSELHYKTMTSPQEDDPSIQYNMTYQYIGRWTPRIENWYNSLFCKGKGKPVYIKAKKVELPF